MPPAPISFRLQTQISEEGLPSCVLRFLRGCNEAGAGRVGRIRELEVPVGWVAGTSPFSLLLPLILPLVHSTVGTQWGAGPKRRNCGSQRPSPD